MEHIGTLYHQKMKPNKEYILYNSSLNISKIYVK